MSDIRSSLVLQKLVFDRINFERKGFKNENGLSVKIGVQTGENSEKTYVVKIVLEGEKKEEYVFEISLSGYFSINDAEMLGEETVKDLVNKNAVAILMPYLRAEVSLLTAQPGTESVVLPPFNINKLMG